MIFKPIDVLFNYWMIFTAITFLIFLINPLIAILYAIVMIPIFMIDILLKFFKPLKK